MTTERLLSVTKITESPDASEIGQVDYSVYCDPLMRFLKANGELGRVELHRMLDALRAKVDQYAADAGI